MYSLERGCNQFTGDGRRARGDGGGCGRVGAAGEKVQLFLKALGGRIGVKLLFCFLFRVTRGRTPLFLCRPPPPVLLPLTPPERLQPITWGHRRAGFKADKCI